MIDCVSVQNMRISDQRTIEKGTPGIELIRRAAYGVYRNVVWNGKVAIVCGSGNNGADGFALACILRSKEIDVTAIKISERLHDDCSYFALEAEKCGVPLLFYKVGIHMLHEYDIIVDCMLGTGFQGELREIYRCAIEEINETSSYVVSVDINSGMNGDTGEGSAIVYSDLTVAIEFIKYGMILDGSSEYIKRLICVKIGIELAEPEKQICNEKEWFSLCERLQVSPQNNSVEYAGMYFMRSPKWLDMSAW